MRGTLGCPYSHSEDAMRLRILQDYHSNAVTYRAGDVIDVPDDLGQWLQRDSVGSFEEIKPEKPRRTLRKPPADKAISEAVEK
jgi:hypothetical protein